MFKDIHAGPNSSNPASFAEVGGTLFFRAYTSEHGTELHQTDGSSESTAVDFVPGNGGVYPDSLSRAGGDLYFTGDDGSGIGAELYRLSVDKCYLDDTKLDPGVCGCGAPDVDADSDGALDCLDECPGDAAKKQRGACGCGMPDQDANGNGRADCLDPTSSTAPSIQKISLNKKTGELRITLQSVPGSTRYLLTFTSYAKVLVKGKKKFLSASISSRNNIVKIKGSQAAKIAAKIKSKAATLTVRLFAGTIATAVSRPRKVLLVR